MPSSGFLEITITHNFAGKEPPRNTLEHTYWEGDRALTQKLYAERRIGIRFFVRPHIPDAETLRNRLNEGLEPKEMKRVLKALWSEKDAADRSQLLQLYQMTREGGAVIAAYQDAIVKSDEPGLKKGERLVGRIERGTEFKILDPPPGAKPDPRLHKVLSLRLTEPRLYRSSSSFLGNLPSNRRTLQSCASRARGRLAWLARCQGAKEPKGILDLHHRDAEWFVQNWLVLHYPCCLVYKGSASDEGVDHKVWRADGGLALAQTTISDKEKPILDKLETLSGMEADARILFAPEAAREEFEKWKNKNPSYPIEFWSLERVEKDLMKAKPVAAEEMMKALLKPEPVQP